MKPVAPKVATIVVERVVQRKGSAVPLVSRFISKRASRATSGSTSERLVAMKSEKVDSTAKVASGPTSYVGSCEKSTESGSDEFPKIYVLLKADLLEDVDTCAKFVDSVRKIVCSDSFAKRPAYSRRFSLLVTL